MKKKWSPEEKTELIRLRAKRINPAGIAKLLNDNFWSSDSVRSPISVTRHLENNGLNIERCREIAEKEPEPINIPIFLDKKKAEDINWREWFKNLKQRQDLHQRTSSSQDEATIEIKTDKKIAVLFSADWHTGSVAVDYDELEQNLGIILNTDRVYMITVGDLIDSFRNFRSLQPVLSQIISPREQTIVLESILGEFIEKAKWLAATWGTHDVERDERIYGESTVKNLLSKNLVYFNGKGTLNLIVNSQRYIIRMAHELKGFSIHNPNHPQGRELRWYSPDADVIASAHKHQPACQNFYQYGQPKCLIQTGTFQTDDGWSKRWYGKGTVGVPTVVFHPDRHDCFVYRSLNELLEGF